METRPVLLDASVVRSVTVLGWIDHLLAALPNAVLVAHGVLAEPAEPSELRGIRDALHREANVSRPGSGRQSRAMAATVEIDQLLGPPTKLALAYPTTGEYRVALRLTSMDPDQRSWRQKLGLRARRLDAGEAVSISIAQARDCDFASDDEQALIAFTALTGRPAARTVDIIRLLVQHEQLDEIDARHGYALLRADDLHLLGGPDW
jgi:hypothetical protein